MNLKIDRVEMPQSRVTYCAFVLGFLYACAYLVSAFQARLGFEHGGDYRPEQPWWDRFQVKLLPIQADDLTRPPNGRQFDEYMDFTDKKVYNQHGHSGEFIPLQLVFLEFLFFTSCHSLCRAQETPNND